ncbi:prephenate dehydrogenase/arogenate dehydrogenase family protein [Streptomyces sp. LE64]|uniref:prephenate dehydrogenase/arogenate dehydrogenase family protein n=1 Tax=Streptomyces sp. LE64 TaxID=3448653 RepID=UPI0040426CDC
MSAPAPRTGPERIRRAVVVGHGNVGRLLTGLLASAGWRTVAADPAARPTGTTPLIRDDIATPGAELRAELAAADAVFVAVPEQAAVAAVPVLAGTTAPTATVVETLSHKHRFLELAEDGLAPRPVLSLNPLFHPSLGWAGNAVTASLTRGDDCCERLLELLAGTGVRVERLSHRDHDRYVTTVQAATHAALLSFTAALARLGLDPALVAACAPPPTRALLALTARVLSADVETYWDIQAAGEDAGAARAALGEALAALGARARADGGEEEFRTHFTDLADWYGEGLDGAAADAARLLGALIAPAPPGSP